MAKSKSFFESGALFCKAEPSPTLSMGDLVGNVKVVATAT